MLRAPMPFARSGWVIQIRVLQHYSDFHNESDHLPFAKRHMHRRYNAAILRIKETTAAYMTNHFE
jgi:hypothetical protein